MAYTKTNWENSPSTNTPINATNLNKIENELQFLDVATTYSLNETRIGTWANGKPLYRRVIQTNCASNSGTVTDVADIGGWGIQLVAKPIIGQILSNSDWIDANYFYDVTNYGCLWVDAVSGKVKQLLYGNSYLNSTLILTTALNCSS